MKWIKYINALWAVIRASRMLGNAYSLRWRDNLDEARQEAQHGIDLLSLSKEKVEFGIKAGVLVGLVIVIEEIAYHTQTTGVSKELLSKSIDQLRTLEKMGGSCEFCKNLPFLASRLNKDVDY